jgi:predicted DNA-binding mobile mystery protein A
LFFISPNLQIITHLKRTIMPEVPMRQAKRELAQSDIERQLRPFRRAAHNHRPPEGWLRALRQAFNLPAEDIASDLKLTPKMVFQLERSEEKMTITLERLEAAARAMHCDLVYAIVPWDRSIHDRAAEQADRNLWRKRFSVKGW